MAGALQLLAGGALLVAASGATTLLLRPEDRLDAAITTGVLAAAGVTAIMLLAGAAGALRPGVVLALEAAWAVAAIVAARRAGRRLPGLPRPPAAVVREHPWEATLVAVAGLALAWQLLVALVLPPYAYDALTYHLTMVATWVDQGDLGTTPLSLCCAYYPANAELLVAWPYLLAGGDALAGTVQVAFATLGGLAVAGIARTARLPSAACAAAAALFVLTPVVLAQAPTEYADVTTAACVLAALHALSRYAAGADPRRLAVAALATGLVTGTKGTGIVWGAVLTLTALGLVARHARGGRLPSRRALGVAAVALSLVAALGAPWYVRNWVDAGNPLYPFRVELAGVRVFDGPLRVDEVLVTPAVAADRSVPVQVAASWATDLRFWRQDSYDYQSRGGGLGPLWAWLALPLLLPFAVMLARRRSVALVGLLPILVVFAVQPLRWWARFTIPLAAAGAIAVVAVAVWAPRRWIARGVHAAALVLALTGAVITSRRVDPAGRAPALSAGRVLGLIGEPAAERTVGRLFFPEYAFLERVPADATVAVDLHARPVRFVYPLFGPHATRRVVPARAGAIPAHAWVVTGVDRPLDRALRRDPRFRPEVVVRGLRAWRPVR